MRIAIIGSNNKDSMESNLMEAFIYAGHICEIFDIIYSKNKFIVTFDKLLRTYSDKYDKELFIKLAYKVNDYNPDLVICVYRIIHPIFVKKIKQFKKTIIHINPDSMMTLGYQQIFMSDYDVWFTKDPYILKFMKYNMHLNAVYYNEAFSARNNPKPDIPKHVMEEEVNIDVMTYGTMYPYRCKMLKCVLDEGINLKVFGVIPNRFYMKELDSAYQHKYIVGAEKAKLLYGSKIIFNQMHFAEIEGVNCRFFEIYGAAGFQLSDYRPILHDLLPIDPELVSFKNIDDGIEKIKYYLEQPDKRHHISKQIYQHFITLYSYDQLIKYILCETFK